MEENFFCMFLSLNCSTSARHSFRTACNYSDSDSDSDSGTCNSPSS